MFIILASKWRVDVSSKMAEKERKMHISARALSQREVSSTDETDSNYRDLPRCPMFENRKRAQRQLTSECPLLLLLLK